MDLDQRINELERIVEEMYEKVEHLNTMVMRLSICKLVDPRKPYYNWMASISLDDNKRCQFEALMSILAMRLEGEKIPEEFKCPIKNIQFDLLYKDEIPNYEDTANMIKEVMEFGDTTTIPRLLKLIYAEGRQMKLCEHLLNQIGENVLED